MRQQLLRHNRINRINRISTDALDEMILGRPATPEESERIEEAVQWIAAEEDRCFMELAEKFFAHREDRKLRKTNYRAWKAKHGRS
jgi:hypothetical protein